MDVAYVIRLSELSKIVERIIEASFNAHKETTEDPLHSVRLLHTSMEEWEAKVPPELSYRQKPSELWVCAPHSAYRYVSPSCDSSAYRLASWIRILLYRSLDPFPSIQAHGRAPADAIDAANQITRHVESLLSSGRIHQAPIHLIPSLFAAMGIHATDLIGDDRNSVWTELGQIKIRLCLIALKRIKSAWPVAGWVEELFARFLLRHTPKTCSCGRRPGGQRRRSQPRSGTTFLSTVRS